MTIVPAVIPESVAHLAESLRTIETFSREVQIDIVDGVYVPYTSWPYTEHTSVQALSAYTEKLTIEVDLMIETPEQVIREYLATGVQRVVVHLESVKTLAPIVACKQEYSFALGFSVNNDTPLSVLESVVGYADFVQLMGISQIGTQGQPFDERVLARMRTIVSAHHTSLPISVDGSVNGETLSRLKEAGAERLVVGSYIMHAQNPHEAYRTLTQLV